MAKLMSKKTELAAITEKRARIARMQGHDLIEHLNLEPVKYTQYDTPLIWEDIKESEAYVDIEGVGRFGRGLKIHEYSSEDKAKATTALIKKYRELLDEMFPIEVTAHLLNWYSIFKPSMIDLKCYEPTDEDYQIYFTLKGSETKVYKLEEMANCGILFYYLIKKLYFQQAQDKRQQVIRYILSDSDAVEQLKANSWVAPASLQFILTTSQVYQAYAKARLDGKELPLPLPHEENKRSISKSYRENRKYMNKLAREVLAKRKDGFAVKAIEGGQIIFEKTD